MFRNEDRTAWVVKFWPDSFDMLWYEITDWPSAIRKAFELERGRR